MSFVLGKWRDTYNRANCILSRVVLLFAIPACHWLRECLLLAQGQLESSPLGLGEASPSRKGSLKPTAATFLAA